MARPEDRKTRARESSEPQVEWEEDDGEATFEPVANISLPGNIPPGMEAGLRKALRIMDAPGGRAILVNGDTGTGKTMFMDIICDRAQESGETVFRSSGSGRFSKPLQPIMDALSGEGGFGDIIKVDELSLQQVFLIDKNSGILIAHQASSGEEIAMDEDLVSSMFTAIQSFVGDSFKTTTKGAGSGGLGKLEYMDTVIIIEHGNFGYIAAVLNGTEDPNIRIDLRTALDSFEAQNRDRLSSFDGDITALSGLDDLLTGLIRKRYTRVIERGESQLESDRIRIFESVRNILQHISMTTKALLVIDNLHNCDEASVRLLEFLTPDLEQMDMTILCSYTEQEMPPAALKHLRTMIDVHGATLIELKPLDRNQTMGLVNDILPDGLDPEEVVKFGEQVFGATGGIPSLIMEVISGVLATSARSGDEIILPDAAVSMDMLKDHYLKRVDRLRPRELLIAEWSSVIGQVFDLETLVSCAQLPESDIQMALEQLINDRIIERRGEDVFAFVDERVHSLTHTGISERWQRIMHSVVGEHIKKAHDDNSTSRIFAMADHFSRGLDPYKAVTYCHRAGDMALQMLSVETAINYYHLALNACSGLSLSEGRLTTMVVLNMKLAQSQYLRGSEEEALHHAQKVIELWSQPQEKPFLARALRIQARVLMDRGNHNKALEHARQGVKISREIEDPDIWEAMVTLGDIYTMLGQMKRAWKVLQDAEAYCKEKEVDEGLTAIYQSQALVYLHTGRYREAINHLEKALGEAFPRNDKRNMSRIYTDLGWCYLMMYKYSISIDYLNEGIKYAKEIGYTSQLGHCYAHLAQCQAMENRIVEARKSVDKAHPIFERLSDRRMLAYLDMVLAVIHSISFHEKMSEELFSSAHSIFHSLRDSELIALSSELHGRMLSMRGKKEGAIKAFGSAHLSYKKMSNRGRAKEMTRLLGQLKDG